MFNPTWMNTRPCSDKVRALCTELYRLARGCPGLAHSGAVWRVRFPPEGSYLCSELNRYPFSLSEKRVTRTFNRPTGRFSYARAYSEGYFERANHDSPAQRRLGASPGGGSPKSNLKR